MISHGKGACTCHTLCHGNATCKHDWDSLDNDIEMAAKWIPPCYPYTVLFQF